LRLRELFLRCRVSLYHGLLSILPRSSPR
jgi:hypothetical protein